MSELFSDLFRPKDWNMQGINLWKCTQMRGIFICLTEHQLKHNPFQNSQDDLLVILKQLENIAHYSEIETSREETSGC